MTTLVEYPLGLRLAERRVTQFGDDPWNADYANSVELCNCQEWLEKDWLQKGIDAFRQIQKSNAEIREAAFEKLIDLTPDLQRHIDSLYEAWLKNVPAAERWIERSNKVGLCPHNLDEFNCICEEARATIEAREWAQMSFEVMKERMAQEEL